MMKSATRSASPSKAKEPPKMGEAAKAPSPMAPQPTATGGKHNAPSVAQPAGARFKAPPAPSAAPGMPSASKRLDKTT